MARQVTGGVCLPPRPSAALREHLTRTAMYTIVPPALFLLLLCSSLCVVFVLLGYQDITFIYYVLL